MTQKKIPLEINKLKISIYTILKLQKCEKKEKALEAMKEKIRLPTKELSIADLSRTIQTIKLHKKTE